MAGLYLIYVTPYYKVADQFIRLSVTNWLLSGMGDRSRVYCFRISPSHSTQPGHPSLGGQNEYWQWLQPPLGKKWRVLRNRTAAI